MQRAFSLVELSIVLVILGLLTGGILAGQSLIRAAELRSIITQQQQYFTALGTFRDKYMAIPGDMNNATRFWGDRATGTAACPDPAIPDGTPGTCNGNNDGILSNFTESYRFWQQLGMAGLIEGNYQGWVNPATNATQPVRGLEVPASKLSDSFWQAINISQNATTNHELGFADLPDIRYNMLVLCGPNPGWWCERNVLRPEEAWNIDTKMDDGKPAFGKIRGGHTDCATTLAVAANATYNVTFTSPTCRLGFIMN